MAAGDIIQGPAMVETITTNDGNNHEIAVWTLASDTTAYVLVEVLAQRYDSGEDDEVFLHINRHVFNGDSVGAATLRASAAAAELDPQTTGWRVTVDANGADARVQVQGSAGEDVRWACRLTVLQVEQAVAP